MGEALTDEERAIFTKLTGREREPCERVDELWCIIGRRGGKSRAIAALLVYLATMVDYSAQLVSGESGVVLCLARTQEQAQVVLRYVAGIIDNAPILAKMVIRRAADSLTLSNRGATIEIAVRAASYRSIRGMTCVAAVADEIAFWQADDGSANPDTEILRAIRPSLLTTRGPLIAISSPYARKGELWTTFKRDYGAQGDPRILVARAASREMNPTLRQADIDREMARDPASGLAEYYAEFRTDISAFVSQEVIDGCIAHGVFELPPAAGVSYLGFVDPSGGASDAMTLAIAHRVGDMVILDAAREIQPPFNPDAATTEFSTLLKAYRIGKVIGDQIRRRMGPRAVSPPWHRVSAERGAEVGHLPRRAAVVQRRPGAALGRQAAGQSAMQPGAADGARRTRPDRPSAAPRRPRRSRQRGLRRLCHAGAGPAAAADLRCRCRRRRRSAARRCRRRSVSSPLSGRRAPTLPWCTVLRRAGRKSFSSPTLMPGSITAVFSPTSQRG